MWIFKARVFIHWNKWDKRFEADDNVLIACLEADKDGVELNLLDCLTQETLDAIKERASVLALERCDSGDLEGDDNNDDY
jgi:hypothetical protein